MRISANSAFAYVDYVIALKWGSMRKEAIVYSCYSRSEIELRSFTANLGFGNAVLYPEEDGGGDIIMFPRMDADSYRTRMLRGKSLSPTRSVCRKRWETDILSPCRRSASGTSITG